MTVACVSILILNKIFKLKREERGEFKRTKREREKISYFLTVDKLVRILKLQGQLEFSNSVLEVSAQESYAEMHIKAHL